MVVYRLMLLAGVLAGSSGVTAAPMLTSELVECSKSLATPQVAADVSFENQSRDVVDILWVEVGTARPVLYRALKPGEVHSQPTYVCHLWAVIGKEGKFLGSHCAGEGHAIVSITPESVLVRAGSAGVVD